MRFSTEKGWREIGDKKIYIKSKWEHIYAYYLEWQKQEHHILDWEYEPKTFWFEGIKRGCVSYKPDFRVIVDLQSHYWVEVKGYMDSRSKTKLKRFKRYFPNESIFVADGSWFSKNSWKVSLVTRVMQDSSDF